MATDLRVRKLNLIDLLIEENDDVEEPPEYAADLWSEDQIRTYFDNGGILRGLPVPTADYKPGKANGDDGSGKGEICVDKVCDRWISGTERWGCVFVTFDIYCRSYALCALLEGVRTF